MGLTSNIKDKDWVSVRQGITKLGSTKLGPGSTPTYAGLTLTGLTVNSLIYPVLADDGTSTGALTSLGAATDGQLPIGDTGGIPILANITGNASQVIVTNGAGTIALSTPQNIHTGATPTFAGLILSGTVAIGLDMSGGTFATAIQKWPDGIIQGTGGVRFNLSDSFKIQNAATPYPTYFEHYDTGNNSATQLVMRKSASDTLGTVAETSSGDILGQLIWEGVNGNTAFDFGAQIKVMQSGASGAANVPTTMEFNTWTNSGINENHLFLDGPTGFSGFGTDLPKTKVTIEGALTLKERAAAESDTAAYAQIWAKNDAPNTLWFRNDVGADLRIAPQDLQITASPTFVALTLSAGPLDITGKITAGSFGSPVDVTNTRQYGAELHYSGNNYDVTGIRSRAQLVTTDASTRTALGGLFQAANNDNIDAGVLMGFMAEAIGKSTSNASTITTMRGGLIGTEWGAFDTVTNLKTLHLRGHSRNAAGAGSFGTGYALYIENEAVGGNGQAYDAGIYFKGTNLSGGNKAYTYGIDFSGGTYGTAELKLSNGETIDNLTDGTIKVTGAFESTGIITTPGLTITNCAVLGSDSAVFQPNADAVDFFQVRDAAGEIVSEVDTTGSAVNFYGDSSTLGVKLRRGVAGESAGTVNLYGSFPKLLFYTQAGANAASMSAQSSNGTITYGAPSGFRISPNAGGSATPTLHIDEQGQIAAGTSTTRIGQLALYNKFTTNPVINARGASGQSVDLQRWQNFAGTTLAFVDKDGKFELDNAEPYITLHNSTHEDTDGGGESRIIGKREDGAGTPTEAGMIEISHDGSVANDQLGKITEYVNTGAGLVQVVEKGSDLLATFAGGVTVNGLSVSIVAKTAAYTATANDDVITCGAGNETFTIDLPVPVTGKTFYIKNVGTGVITVDADTTGSSTIDGDTTQTVNQYECLKVVSDASVYWAI